MWVQGFEPWATNLASWRSDLLSYTHMMVQYLALNQGPALPGVLLAGVEPAAKGLGNPCSSSELQQLTYPWSESNTRRRTYKASRSHH